MTPRKFVKRPVVIEAHQLGNDYDDDCAAIGWCGGRAVGEEEGEHAMIAIDTLEGTMIANSGDYIIKGVQGEFYPCKPEIFEQSYERIMG
mgnify:CR=1 FL=1